MKRLSLLCWCAAALLAPSAAAAQSEAEWRSVHYPNSCALELVDANSSVQFSFDQQLDRYSLTGELIDRLAPEDGSTPLVLLRIGNENIFLAGPPGSYQRTNWDPPIQRIIALAKNEEPFTLLMGEAENELSLVGLADASVDMQECLKVRRATIGPRGPVLLAFEGIHQLTSEATRQRLLSQKLGFTLTVGADGKPVECDLTREFRRRATEVALCRPLLKYMKFEPAIDADGKPTTGRYSSEIDFQMWMSDQGYLEPESR